MALDPNKLGSQLKQALGEQAQRIADDLELDEQKLDDGRRKAVGFQKGNKHAVGHKRGQGEKTKIKSCLETLEAAGFNPWIKAMELFEATDSDKVRLGIIQTLMKYTESVPQTVKVEHRGAPTKIVFQWQGPSNALDSTLGTVIDVTPTPIEQQSNKDPEQVAD